MIKQMVDSELMGALSNVVGELQSTRQTHRTSWTASKGGEKQGQWNAGELGWEVMMPEDKQGT